jgi:AraC-like DNA-binding protein
MSESATEPRQTRFACFGAFGLAVVKFRCRAHVQRAGQEEPNPTNSIVLVRRGVFGRSRRGDTVLADANHVLFFNAGEPYRYSHPVPGGDDCTILTVETRRALELVARHAPRDAEDPQAPFRWGHALSDPRVAMLHYEMLRLLRHGGSRLAMEDALLELADESVGACYRAGVSLAYREPPARHAARRRRDLVETVKLAINQRLESPPPLGELAIDCDCSPFHLSRTFRDTVGVSLRRYVRRLRTRVAADHLTRGPRDLTRLGLDLGYADHSHFTNTFRSEWGIPPSRFRARLGPS